jgi:hypothetical protein
MDNEIANLRALLVKATALPWRGVPADDYVIEADGYPRTYGGRFKEDSTGSYLAIVGNHPSDYGEANRDLIVAAVNALPKLLYALSTTRREAMEEAADIAETQTERTNRDCETEEGQLYGAGYENACADAAAAIRRALADQAHLDFEQALKTPIEKIDTAQPLATKEPSDV